MFTDKPMIIYFVRLNNEIVYIGQTKLSLEDRKKQHEYNASRGKGYILGSGIRKHKPESFVWNVHSVYFNQKDLDAAEKHYISKYRPRYNINLGGEARGLRKKGGIPWNKGKTGVQQNTRKGLKETRPDVLARMKESAKNRKRTPRPNDTQTAKKARAEGRRKTYLLTQRPFMCHQNGKIYQLVVDAAKDLNVLASGIYAVLNPKHAMKSYKGFTFSYVKTDQDCLNSL